MHYLTNFSGISLLVILGGILPTTSCMAEDLANGWDPAPLELLQVPQYCQKQFLSKHDAKVMSTLFFNCERINHFCPGLILINRAMKQSIPKSERQRILSRAKGELDYTESKMTKSCSVKRDIDAAQMRIRMLETVLK